VNSNIWIAAAIALSLTCSVCQQPTLPNYPERELPARDREVAATVVILDPNSGYPRCSAVSIYGQDGTAVLATAAHCVTKNVDEFDVSPEPVRSADIGDEIRYVVRDDWYHTASASYLAKVQSIDLGRDRATLKVNQYEVPQPLLKVDMSSVLIPSPVHVHALSAFFGWQRRDGDILKSEFSGVGSFFLESSMTIDFGWSGSPVIMDTGEVLGIVLRCADKDKNKVCDPGWSLFTTL